MRHSFYRDIHKGIRLMVSELTVAAGSTDFANERELASLSAKVSEAFALLEGHAKHESGHIGPLLERVRPDVYAAIERAHDDQDDQLRELRTALATIECGEPDATDRGHAFVLELSRLTSEIFVHMADEEEIVMPALWAAVDDATLLEVHQRLVSSIPPAEMMGAVSIMVPGMNHPERVEFLASVQRGAPPPAFAAMLDVARARLDPVAFARLDEALTRSQRAA